MTVTSLSPVEKIKVLEDLVVSRRSTYAFKPELPTGVTEKQVTDVVEFLVKHTPTSFNIQNVRAIILYGDANKKLWGDVYEAVKDLPFHARPQSLKDTSYGTVVFFDDQPTIDAIGEKFAGYKDFFPTWAAHANGFAEITTWEALHALGLGANLQHFNPWVEKSLSDKVDTTKWKVTAQLAFGLPTEAAGAKEFIENPIKVFK